MEGGGNAPLAHAHGVTQPAVGVAQQSVLAFQQRPEVRRALVVPALRQVRRHTHQRLTHVGQLRRHLLYL
jgi:hypothetical protein